MVHTVRTVDLSWL